MVLHQTGKLMHSKRNYPPEKKKERKKIFDREKILANHILSKNQYPKYLKNSYNSITTTNIWLNHGKRTGTDIFPKKTYRWPTGTWKDTQDHYSSEKYKPKPQWYITLHFAIMKKAIDNKYWWWCREKGTYVHRW